MLSRIINILKTLSYRFLFSGSYVRCDASSHLEIEDNVKIKKSRIRIIGNSKVIIQSGTLLEYVCLTVNNGVVVFGNNNIIQNIANKDKLLISVNVGELIIGDYNRIRSKILVRFGGVLSIGNRTNINEYSELRCDESLAIGSYNQISYNCMIWDTNTHNLYSKEFRRELTDMHYPVFGYEFEKPKSKPVFIGDDCWIGRDVTILKGSYVSSESIIATRTVLSGQKIESKMTVYHKSELTMIKKY